VLLQSISIKLDSKTQAMSACVATDGVQDTHPWLFFLPKGCDLIASKEIPDEIVFQAVVIGVIWYAEGNTVRYLGDLQVNFEKKGRS
jgi:hypothetical protein